MSEPFETWVKGRERLVCPLAQGVEAAYSAAFGVRVNKDGVEVSEEADGVVSAGVLGVIGEDEVLGRYFYTGEEVGILFAGSSNRVSVDIEFLTGGYGLDSVVRSITGEKSKVGDVTGRTLAEATSCGCDVSLLNNYEETKSVRARVG